MTGARRTFVLALGLSLLGACRKREATPRRTEPWLAHPSSAPQAARGLRFEFDRESRVRFTTVGRKGKVSGSAPVSGGELELDPTDLTRTRASVAVDLRALELDPTELPPSLELGDLTPRTLALYWLELGPRVPQEKLEQFSVARFELASVEGWSGAPLETSGRKPASLRATAIGSLLLHGFRAPVRAEVHLGTIPGAGGTPPRVTIRSATPVVLPLAPHDISARGPDGVVDTATTARAADFIGSSVRLELSLVGVPVTPPNNRNH